MNTLFEWCNQHRKKHIFVLDDVYYRMFRANIAKHAGERLANRMMAWTSTVRPYATEDPLTGKRHFELDFWAGQDVAVQSQYLGYGGATLVRCRSVFVFDVFSPMLPGYASWISEI